MRVRFAVCSIALVALIGCGPTAGTLQTGSEESGSRPGQAKTLTIGVTNSVAGFGPWNLGSNSDGAKTVSEAYSAALVMWDVDNNREPWLAS